MKKIITLLVALLILVGCGSNHPESSAVESSDLSGSSLFESATPSNSPQVSESPSHSTELEQEISESSSSLTESEQEILESDDESFIAAPIGKPDNFTELPPDRIKTLPFSESQIEHLEFSVMFKYGPIEISDKEVIKKIIEFINEMQISDSQWTGTQKPGLFVRFHLQDGTNTEIFVVDKGIEINTKLYSVANGEIYPKFENMLDNIILQSYVNKGLLSAKGIVNSSTKIEQYTYLYELDTDSGTKTIQVTQGGSSDIIQINWQAEYPLEEKQIVLVFYEKESNPIVPEAILLY